MASTTSTARLRPRRVLTETSSFHMLLNDEDRELLRRAADLEGRSVGAFLRYHGRKIARKLLLEDEAA